MKKIFLFLILGMLMTCVSCSPGGKQSSGQQAWQEIKSSQTIAATPTHPATATIPVTQVHRLGTFQVSVTHGIRYAEGLSHSDWDSDEVQTIPLLLDLYEPIGAPLNRPAMVWIHGGGFRIGNRKTDPIVEMANYFAQRGWVVISIDYRLERDHGTVSKAWSQIASQTSQDLDSFNRLMAIYPAARDAKAAVRWLYANAEVHGINADHITVGGGSAGAYLSVMLGATDDADFLGEISPADDPTLASTNPSQPSRVHTVIDLWGGPSVVSSLEIVYKVTRFDERDAPILIVHGMEDETVDFSEAEKMRAIYEQTGVDFAFHALPGEGHSAWSAEVDGLSLAELIFDYVVSQQGLVVVE